MRVVWADRRFDENGLVTGGQRYDFEILRYLEKAGVPVLSLKADGSSGGIRRRGRLLSNVANARRLATLGMTDDTVLLEDYSTHAELLLVNPLVHAMGRGKVVCILHNFYFTFRRGVVKNAVDRLATVPFVKSADLVITPTQTVAAQVSRVAGLPPERMVVSYNALRPEIVRGACLRQDIKGGRAPVRVLFVGYLTPRKGLEYLIEAFGLLADVDCRLTIVGDLGAYPSYAQVILNKAEALGLQERVSFAGFVSTAALVDMYRSADVFVLPSLDEGFGVALAEAMCFGLPVVATTAGAIPELVEDGVNGTLVPAKDPRALAKAIAMMVENPHLRSQFGRESFRKSHVWHGRIWDDVGQDACEAMLKLVQG